MSNDKHEEEDEDHIDEESEELDLDDLDDDDLETDLEDLTEEEEFTDADFEDDDAVKGLFDEELEESEIPGEIASSTPISSKIKPAKETENLVKDSSNNDKSTEEENERTESSPTIATPLPPAEPVKIVPLKPEEIPVTVVVEVGHFNISVKKLLELEPGNLIEMDIHPERGVDLVVNGKLVGRGELIRLGDVLGVRVLEIGK